MLQSADLYNSICFSLHIGSPENLSDFRSHSNTNNQKKLKPCVRRAYYCLSLDQDFPEPEEIMNFVGREHVYCSIIKSVNNFLQLSNHFFWDNSDPCKMNMLPVLINNVQRKLDTDEKSGKLIFFLRGKWLFEVHSVKTLWQELREFGDEHKLHVSVTTAFPSVEYKVL